MNFEEFQNLLSTDEEFQSLIDSRLGTYSMDVEDFLKYCDINGIHCETYSVVNDEELAKMVVIWINGKFYVTTATKAADYLQFTLYYDQFEEVRKEVIERELKAVKDFYANAMGIEKLLDENYKNKIMLQKTFGFKNE